MKGKLLENIVLAVGLLIIATASFLMFFDETGQAAQRINLIFASGFIVYIIYSYLLSQNLNGEIYNLKKHVANLKEEVARLTQTVANRDATITRKKQEISTLSEDLARTQSALETKENELLKAKAEIASLKEKQEKEE